MDLLKIVLIIAGTLSLVIGIAGIVIPGVPTTPFLLLTAGLYMRSSEKLYEKLLANKWINQVISQYRKNKGMSRKTKIYSILLMWVMIGSSCLFFITANQVKLIVILLGLAGMYIMWVVVPTANSSRNKS